MPFDVSSLLDFLTADGPERVGFVLKDDSIVEVQNMCHDPVNGFEVRGEDLLKYEHEIKATWHTHPGEEFSSNLTVADRLSYLSYPDWEHYIVGRDGVSCYVVDGGKVLVASSHPPARQTQ